MRILVRQVRGRRRAPNWSGIAREVARTIDQRVKPKLIKDFEKVVANWDNKPQFKAKKSIGKDIVVYVFPTGPNAKYWIWTSRGTKPHKIKAKPGGVLVFPTGYTPKTSPSGPSYGGPGKSSGETVFATEVKHPGTEPRKFEEDIGKKANKWFKKEIENAMRRGARKA